MTAGSDWPLLLQLFFMSSVNEVPIFRSGGRQGSSLNAVSIVMYDSCKAFFATSVVEESMFGQVPWPSPKKGKPSHWCVTKVTDFLSVRMKLGAIVAHNKPLENSFTYITQPPPTHTPFCFIYLSLRRFFFFLQVVGIETRILNQHPGEKHGRHGVPLWLCGSVVLDAFNAEAHCVICWIPGLMQGPCCPSPKSICLVG